MWNGYFVISEVCMKLNKTVEVEIDLSIKDIAKVVGNNNDVESWGKIRDLISEIDENVGSVEFSHSLLKRLASDLKPHVSAEDFEEIINSLKED